MSMSLRSALLDFVPDLLRYLEQRPAGGELEGGELQVEELQVEEPAGGEQKAEEPPSKRVRVGEEEFPLLVKLLSGVVSFREGADDPQHKVVDVLISLVSTDDACYVLDHTSPKLKSTIGRMIFVCLRSFMQSRLTTLLGDTGIASKVFNVVAGLSPVTALAGFGSLGLADSVRVDQIVAEFAKLRESGVDRVLSKLAEGREAWKQRIEPVEMVSCLVKVGTQLHFVLVPIAWFSKDIDVVHPSMPFGQLTFRRISSKTTSQVIQMICCSPPTPAQCLVPAAHTIVGYAQLM
jgi:hypothetical protein